MPQEFLKVHYDVRAMDLVNRKVITRNNISGGELGAAFIKTANQRDLRFGKYDNLLRDINHDDGLRSNVGVFPNYLVVFWAAARTDGFVPTRLVGMVDQESYESFQRDGMRESPDNAWFRDDPHAILVAAALSQLYANL